MATLKTCPKCGITHKKRGPFCGYSCANAREQTPEIRHAKSEKLKAYHQSPEGIATASMSRDFMRAINRERANDRSGEYTLKDEDWMLDIPVQYDEENGDTYSDGNDIWRS
jgi:rRNA maturation protein Nop10